jgi:hypothetical protein
MRESQLSRTAALAVGDRDHALRRAGTRMVSPAIRVAVAIVV